MNISEAILIIKKHFVSNKLDSYSLDNLWNAFKTISDNVPLQKEDKTKLDECIALVEDGNLTPENIDEMNRFLSKVIARLENKAVPEEINQENPEVKFKKSYEADKELIEKTMKQAHDFGDSSARSTITRIIENRSFFASKPGNGILFDIGCGKGGGHYAQYVLNAKIGIKLVILVDPFVDKKDLDHLKPGSIEFYKADGLNFLNSLEDNAGNVMTNSIDFEVVGDSEYLRRMAQEIYRVVPENGFFISCLCRDIEKEAIRLFPRNITLGSVKVFWKEKTDIPSEFFKEGQRLYAQYYMLSLAVSPIIHFRFLNFFEGFEEMLKLSPEIVIPAAKELRPLITTEIQSCNEIINDPKLYDQKKISEAKDVKAAMVQFEEFFEKFL